MSGLLIVAEGWEKVGKTSFLKAMQDVGIGTYLKPGNQKNKPPEKLSSIEMMEQDLENPEGLYRSILSRVIRGEVILGDRLWPSAYAYGLWRGEDAYKLIDLCKQIESMLHGRVLHLQFHTSTYAALGFDDPKDKNAKIAVEAGYASFYSSFVDPSRSNYIAIDTAPWRNFRSERERVLWMIHKIGLIAKASLRVIARQEGLYGDYQSFLLGSIRD